MKIVLKMSELQDKADWMWDEVCEDLGLNPWCLNEGLANDDDEISIDVEIAQKYGII